jgi:hypothetical protein
MDGNLHQRRRRSEDQTGTTYFQGEQGTVEFVAEVLCVYGKREVAEMKESIVGKRFLALKKHGMEARVMAETEGYLMVRHKGCVPFVIDKRSFEQQYQEITSGEGVNSFKEMDVTQWI